MFYVTGDIHGKPDDLVLFSRRMKLAADDTIIILGDAGFNFWMNNSDKKTKRMVAGVEPTFFCVHGNHEARPATIESYKEKEWHGGTVWYEEEFPNILFAKDGEIYDLGGKQCLVIGGAYSVDKYWRFYHWLLSHPVDISSSVITTLGAVLDKVSVSQKELDELNECMLSLIKSGTAFFNWWPEELPTNEEKRYIEEKIEKNNRKVDIILSHTCPFKYEPVEAFLPSVNQAVVDTSIERWLDYIDETVDYQKWYCGHWHIDKKIDKMCFLFHEIQLL